MGVIYRQGNTIGGSRSSSAYTANGLWNLYEVENRRRNNIWPEQIVRPGLVLLLDAGFPESYLGSGTTWTDLSGNGNNGTLVNGVGYDSNNLGSLSFDGTNDYVSFSYVQPAYSTTTSFSWNVWVYPTRNNNSDIIMGNRGGGGINGGTGGSGGSGIVIIRYKI